MLKSLAFQNRWEYGDGDKQDDSRKAVTPRRDHYQDVTSIHRVSSVMHLFVVPTQMFLVCTRTERTIHQLQWPIDQRPRLFKYWSHPPPHVIHGSNFKIKLESASQCPIASVPTSFYKRHQFGPSALGEQENQIQAQALASCSPKFPQNFFSIFNDNFEPIFDQIKIKCLNFFFGY